MPEVIAEADAASRLGAWLLGMGFPRAPSREHLLTICRGNYRIVWDSLLKQVLPRTDVQNRRLQVFAADITRCRDFEDDLHEKINAVVPCEELELWRETEILRNKVRQAESRVALSKRNLRTLSGIVADKASQRMELKNDISELRRKSGAINLLSEQLQLRAERLAEMVNIINQLTPRNINNSPSINKTVEMCLSLLSKISCKQAAGSNQPSKYSKSNKQFNSTVLSEVLVSDEGSSERDPSVDIQNKLLELIDKVTITDLWEALYVKQDALNAAMKDVSELSPILLYDDTNCLSVIAETSALHCKLALRTIDMKRRSAALKKKLLELIMGAAGIESDEEAVRELLVLRCEEAGLQGRVTILRDELHALHQHEGIYDLLMRSTEEDRAESVIAAIATINNDLLTKKLDTESSLISAEQTSTKIASVVVQLGTMSKVVLPLQQSISYGDTLIEHEVSAQANYDDFVRHIRPTVRDTSFARRFTKLKEFFTTTDQPVKLNLSLDLDYSADKDINLCVSPGIIDELQFFISKFCLHYNRKLVLPSGESLWISETLEKSLLNTHISATHEVALGAARMLTLHRLVQNDTGTTNREVYGWTTPLHINNIVDIVKNATEKMEHIKKRARDTATSLQQISSLIDVGLDNLTWWKKCCIHSYINEGRFVCDKTYQDYHNLHTHLINNICNSPY